MSESRKIEPVAPTRSPPPRFGAVTPMMVQYLEIKAAHPGCLLFYRMGDFYEMFFEDALQAAKALDITLTKRGQHDGRDIPMCGVPVHASDGYLLRLIRHGFKVAICEQMEDPAAARKRGQQIRGQARGDPPGHAGHDHRGRVARCARPQLPGRAGRGRRRAGAGLARHVDRRLPGPAARRWGRRAGRGAGAPRARRAGAVRTPAGAARAVRGPGRVEGGADAPARRALRQRKRAGRASRRSTGSRRSTPTAPFPGPSWPPRARCSTTWS